MYHTRTLAWIKLLHWVVATAFPVTIQIGALRPGLVTLDQLVLALVEAVESPVQGARIVGVPEIRCAGLQLSSAAVRKTA